MTQKLDDIARALRKGEHSPSVKVRDFLWWFGAQRRGSWIVSVIRYRLKKAGLKTTPNFEHVWLDGHITFELLDVPKKGKPDAHEPEESADAGEIVLSEVDEDAAAGPIWVSREATYRISRLRAANQVVVSVTPDETLPQVITKMMAGGFSQVPVMTNERDVKGIVSWQTIGSRLALGVEGATARQLSEPHHEIGADRSIFDAIPFIIANDYVLVRDAQQKISGIITAADLSLQFRELTEPFLLLSEIENLLRNLIGDRFNTEALRAACDTREGAQKDIETIADLSFGEYIRLLQNPDRWSRLGLAIDRAIFCEGLDQVREIRNDVMHFDPDGIGETELIRLRDFTRFLQQLSTIAGGPRAI